MSCIVCRVRRRTSGLLCEDCRSEIPAPRALLPEQIVRSRSFPSNAALVDPWGRAIMLSGTTVVGRAIDRNGLQILGAFVSRHHAEVSREGPDETWQLRDVGSANGTYLNDSPIDAAVTLRHGDRVGVGPVDFYFVLGAAELPDLADAASVVTAVQPRAQQRFARGTGDTALAESLDSNAGDPGVEDGDESFEAVEMSFLAPTGGGGGIVEVAGAETQLTEIQMQLFMLLARRMAIEVTRPPRVRGFVRSSELAGQLPWDTRHPDENHVKQLVRRLRRTLVRAGIGDLLESRHGFGYRLRVVPRLKDLVES